MLIFISSFVSFFLFCVLSAFSLSPFPLAYRFVSTSSSSRDSSVHQVTSPTQPAAAAPNRWSAFNY